jgi:hypothetical protein
MFEYVITTNIEYTLVEQYVRELPRSIKGYHYIDLRVSVIGENKRGRAVIHKARPRAFIVLL